MTIQDQQDWKVFAVDIVNLLMTFQILTAQVIKNIDLRHIVQEEGYG